MATIGVLAVQGGFSAHATVLANVGHRAVEVRTRDEMARVDGLVLPGGESTVQLALLARFELQDALLEFHRSGRPMLATCAGLILAAREVFEPLQPSFGFIDVTVERNAFGRQRESFETKDDAGALDLVFIRAPRIRRVGAGVDVLASWNGEAVAVRDGNIVGLTFHPELTCDGSVHRAAFGV